MFTYFVISKTRLFYRLSLICYLASEDIKQNELNLFVTMLGELVWPSSKSGRQKGHGLVLLLLSFLFKKVVVCGHCLVTLSITSY